MSHADFPAWYYGPNGEAEIFKTHDAVPQGWLDHPAKHEAKPKAAPPKAAAPKPPTAAELPLTRAQIVSELLDYKVPFKTEAGDQELYDLLVDHIDKTS